MLLLCLHDCTKYGCSYLPFIDKQTDLSVESGTRTERGGMQMLRHFPFYRQWSTKLIEIVMCLTCV